MNLEINYVAVLVSALVSFVIGFLWHGPLFGKVWLRLSGITDADMEAAKAKGGMGPRILAAFVQQLVMAGALACVMAKTGAADVASALALGLTLWLGFVAMPLLNGVLWEKRTVPLYVFNIVYHLVTIVAMTLILALWR